MSDENTTHDETTEDKKPRKRAVRSQQPEVFWFESREREPTTFSIAGVDPIRSFTDGRLLFKVKQEQLQAFKGHYHVVTGRVVRKHENT